MAQTLADQGRDLLSFLRDSLATLHSPQPHPKLIAPRAKAERLRSDAQREHEVTASEVSRTTPHVRDRQPRSSHHNTSSSEMMGAPPVTLRISEVSRGPDLLDAATSVMPTHPLPQEHFED